MASSSSSSSSSSFSPIKRYNVFSSFHGPDVRKRFLSHLHAHFASKGITTFNDLLIERGHTIGPELVQGIRESRVSFVVLSKNYASSSRCLDELVEIFKCKEDFGQIVMPIFYYVDPSDIRKQIGDFGNAFKKICEGKSEEVKQSWIRALADIANIAGEHSRNWDNEAEMIQKIATDVLEKLNATPSSDFEDMGGLEAPLRKLNATPSSDFEDMGGLEAPLRKLNATPSSDFEDMVGLEAPLRKLNATPSSDFEDMVGLEAPLRKLNATPSSDFEDMVGLEAPLRKLNATPSSDFEDMVGLEAPLRKLNATPSSDFEDMVGLEAPLRKLNATPSSDFEDMVGLEAPLRKLNATPSSDFEDMVGLEAPLRKLNATPSSDFEDMVGLEAPLRKLNATPSSDFEDMVGLEAPLRRLNATPSSDFEDIALYKQRSFRTTLRKRIRKSNSSSSLSPIKRHDVFLNFHGPDVRKGFIGHLHAHFASKGITTFNDQEIERGHTIGPELVQGIRESRVSIALISKKYASSSRCLDELVEIFKCKEDFGQIVMPIFYDVDPSDIRKQIGDFGNAFKKICEGKSEEVKQSWIRALADIANIAGEHSRNWDNEAEMIQKIATDVLEKLNVTPSRDFEGMVGLEAHLRKSKSWCSTGMVFLVVINLLLEIVSAVADQLSSIRKPYFARISLVMSILSVVLSIIDLYYKIRDHKARFRFKWPIPWFYYPSRGYNRIFGSFTDTVLLFCAFGQFILSTINYSFIERGLDGPIKVSVWPLIFAICMLGSKFMEKYHF